MIIDSHVHIYPEKIALKAAAGVGNFYNIPMRHDGTVKLLEKLGAEAGIDRFLVHSVATKTEQVVSINNFIAESVKNSGGKFIGFATLHPDFTEEQTEAEIERVIKMGLLGIKLHPDFQHFKINGKRGMKLFERMEGKLPVLVHTGDYRYNYSNPDMVIDVLDAFPKLDFIGAHFGGWSIWDEAERKLLSKRMWVDSSSSTYSMSDERTLELIRAWGAERVLFGSDYPMWSPADELAIIKRLPLKETEKEQILHENIEKLLNL
jgi:predicted TIM-barrel fold metal-dependent hydrolase